MYFNCNSCCVFESLVVCLITSRLLCNSCLVFGIDRLYLNDDRVYVNDDRLWLGDDRV